MRTLVLDTRLAASLGYPGIAIRRASHFGLRVLSCAAADNPPSTPPMQVEADRAAYVAGTFDTKGAELMYIRDCLARLGVRTITVDLSTASGTRSDAGVSSAEVARHHPDGAQAVFTGDRGSAVTAMA